MNSNKKEIKTEFGLRLKNLLKLNDIQQKNLSFSIGIDQNTVSAWITGKQEPTLSNIWSLLDFFKKEYPNVNALKSLFFDFYKDEKIELTEKTKAQLDKIIEYLTKLKNKV